MKYIIYARKSSEEEDRRVLSIEAQLVELREFAAKEKLAKFQLATDGQAGPELEPSP